MCYRSQRCSRWLIWTGLSVEFRTFRPFAVPRRVRTVRLTDVGDRKLGDDMALPGDAFGVSGELHGSRRTAGGGRRRRVVTVSPAADVWGLTPTELVVLGPLCEGFGSRLGRGAINA
jgi:hypothetical protein